MSKNKALVIQFIIVLVVLSIFFIEKKFCQPYETIQSLIDDARENKSIAEYLIEKDEDWERLEDKTMYRLVRKEINWKFFKDFINDKNVESISYDIKGSLIYRIKNFLRKETSTIISTYDSKGNRLNHLRMLLLKTEEGWRVIGTANNKNMDLIKKSKLSPLDIEEYVKDNDQVNVKLLSQKLNLDDDLFDSEGGKVQIADKIVTSLSSDNKSETLLLLLTQRGFHYQFLVFNKEDDYDFIGNIDFGYKHEIKPTFRIKTIDEGHKYLVIKTQAGYGTGINIKEERWYRIEKDKITKVLEYPVDYVMIPPETVSYPIEVLGKEVNSEVVNGIPMIEVDFTISFIYDTSYDARDEKKVSINRKVRYTLEGSRFITEDYEGEYEDWIFKQETNSEILDKNFQKLIEISKSDDRRTIDYLLRFLESCGESNNKEKLIDNTLNYPYIKLRGSSSSILISDGKYLNQSFTFDYRNLDKDIKRVSLWYEDFNEGRLLSNNRIGISNLINRDDKLGFRIGNEGGKGEFQFFTGSASVTTKIEEASANLFLVANADKLRIKKNEEVILGFIVWDADDVQSRVYSFDKTQSIIDAFPKHKVNILKCKFLDSGFER